MKTHDPNKFAIFSPSYDYIDAHPQLKPILQHINMLEKCIEDYDQRNARQPNEENNLKQIQNIIMALLNVLTLDKFDITEVVRLSLTLNEIYEKYLDRIEIEPSFMSTVSISLGNFKKISLEIYLQNYFKNVMKMLSEIQLLDVIKDEIIQLRDQLLLDFRRGLIAKDTLIKVESQMVILMSATKSNNIELTYNYLTFLSNSLIYSHSEIQTYQTILISIVFFVAICGLLASIGAGSPVGIALCVIASICAVAAIFYLPPLITQRKAEKIFNRSLNTIGNSILGFFKSKTPTAGPHDSEEDSVSGVPPHTISPS